ncbi:MAG: hypothetical protein PHH00_00340 [Candidatus Nanoarchaeia archaeon]|nr:hypothetical protein [Candidatus Nanoarchaeia archaeon]
MDKIIIIKDGEQAREYIKNIHKFEDYFPVTLSFSAEDFLSKNGIEFRMEEDYERENTYRGIHKETKEIIKKILSCFKLEYEGIELFSLFYLKLYFLIVDFKKYFCILNEIIKKENPKEILAFRSKSENITGDILKQIFNGKLEVHEYSRRKKKDIRSKFIFRAAGKMQKIYAVINLNLMKEGDSKIFASGGKIYFKSLAELLSRNNKNKIIDFDDCLRKSFFIRKRYLPFYEFSGKKNSENENILTEEMKRLTEEIEKEDLAKESGIENALSGLLKKTLIGIVNQFLSISRKINEMLYLFGNKKINLILLTEDDSEFAKAIARVGKKFNIPTVLFLHGIPCGSVTFGNLESDFFLVFGEKIKDWFVQNKSQNEEDSKKVLAIGCPRYDNFEKKNTQDKIVLYAMEIASGDHLVPETHLTKKRQKEVLRWIFNIMKNLPDYKLIIKTRPGWDMVGLPDKIAKEEKFTNFEVIERTDNAELLNRAKVVLVNHSTMGLEALLLDKKVISVSFKNLDKFNPYKKMKIIEKAYTKAQLEKAINSAIKDKEKPDKGELNRYILTDKTATQRAVQFIENILSKNK